MQSARGKEIDGGRTEGRVWLRDSLSSLFFPLSVWLPSHISRIFPPPLSAGHPLSVPSFCRRLNVYVFSHVTCLNRHPFIRTRYLSRPFSSFLATFLTFSRLPISLNSSPFLLALLAAGPVQCHRCRSFSLPFIHHAALSALSSRSFSCLLLLRRVASSSL